MLLFYGSCEYYDKTVTSKFYHTFITAQELVQKCHEGGEFLLYTQILEDKEMHRPKSGEIGKSGAREVQRWIASHRASEFQVRL